MMPTFLTIFSLIDLCLLGWSFSIKDHRPWRLWLLRLMLLGMAYDNFMLSIANWAIETSWYREANILRFVFHAASLPFLTLFVLACMRDGAIRIAYNKYFVAFCFLFTAIALGYSLFHEVYLLELTIKESWGINRFSSASGIPPLATIFTNLLIIPMAVIIWRKTGWPWLFAGSAFIFIINGSLAGSQWALLAGNTAEVLFISSLLFTARHFGQAKPIEQSLR
ncbi:MAG: hypothetical protein V7711_09025 [Pseudomonadales bacterium]